MKIMLKKFIAVIMLLIVCMGGMCKSYAQTNEGNYQILIRYSDPVLKYLGTNIRNSFAFYVKNQKIYPAYCLNKETPGVGEYEGEKYIVEANETVTDSQIWRVITNGYPYKSLKELNCNTDEEAYAATLQAIYCIKYDRDVDDFKNYQAINASGERVLALLKKLVQIGREGTTSKVSSRLNVISLRNKWEIDSINSEYASQEFEVLNNAIKEKYTILVGANNIDGLLVTDLNNQVKSEFNKGEHFKILIPLDQLTSNGQFYITANAMVNTIPIYDAYPTAETTNAYPAKAPYQNYALTHAREEQGVGSLLVKYQGGKSTITIIKRDNETKERLENAIFNVLDENKTVVYTELATNGNGEIIVDNVKPGDYYLEEISAPDGYQKINELVPFKVKYNQALTINVNNNEIKQTGITSSTGTINVESNYEENVTIKDNYVENIILNEKVDTNSSSTEIKNETNTNNVQKDDVSNVKTNITNSQSTEISNQNNSNTIENNNQTTEIVNQNNSSVVENNKVNNRVEEINNSFEDKQKNINEISSITNHKVKVLPKTGM